MKNGNPIAPIFFIVTIVIALMFSSYIVGREHLYPMTGVVLHVSEETDLVTIKDFNGNLWQFSGVEDWNPDDVVSCIMDDRGTPQIHDDKIVKVRYCGYFEGWG